MYTSSAEHELRNTRNGDTHHVPFAYYRDSSAVHILNTIIFYRSFEQGHFSDAQQSNKQTLFEC